MTIKHVFAKPQFLWGFHYLRRKWTHCIIIKGNRFEQDGNLKFNSCCSPRTFGYAVFVHTFINYTSGTPPPLPHMTVLAATSYLPACSFIPYLHNRFCAALCNTYSHTSRKTLLAARSLTHWIPPKKQYTHPALCRCNPFDGNCVM